jgi:fatty acid amide hydrolase
MPKLTKTHLALLFGAYGAFKFANFLNSRIFNWKLSQKAKKKLTERNLKLIQVPDIDPSLESMILASTASSLAEMIRSGRVTSVEVVSTYIKRARTIGRQLNLTAEECFQEALNEAEKCDKETREGKSRGLLHGVPISVKDHYGMKGFVSSCGLAWKLDYPDQETSTMVQLLVDQGAIPFVRSNVCQGMMWIESSNQIYGKCLNPWDFQRTSGGSSGGEGGLIAARASPLGIGSDIGGSIRVPAAFCGVYGFKASPKRISLKGMYSSSVLNVESFESVIKCSYGPIGRTVDDLVLVMKSWFCENLSKLDPTIPNLPFNLQEFESEKKMKIGFFTHFPGFPVAQCIQNAILRCADALKDCEVVPYSFPDYRKLIFGFLDVYGADVKNDFETMLRGEDPEPYYDLAIFSAHHPYITNIALSILKIFGNQRLAEFYKINQGISAEEILEKFRNLQDNVHEVVKDWQEKGIDAVICPNFGLVAPQHGLTVEVAPSLVYSFIINSMGLPAGSVPAGLVKPEEAFYTDIENDLLTLSCNKVMSESAGLPYSIQVISLPFQDEIVLKVMKKLENILNFHSFPL